MTVGPSPRSGITTDNRGTADLRIAVTIETGSAPYYVNQLEGRFLGDSFAIERDSGSLSPTDTNNSCGSNLVDIEFTTDAR